MQTTTALPKIIQFLDRTDSGEYGNDNCAHCGAKGRYQYRFMCDDGKRHAAMAGCINLYPVSPIAGEHAKIMDKAAKLKSDRRLNGWDTKKLEAIESFYVGTLTEDQALIVIKSENAACRAWVAKKYGR